MEESNPELESFRQQWRAEVSAKGRSDSNKNQTTQQSKLPRKQLFAGVSRSSTSAALPEEEDYDDTRTASNSNASRKSDIQHNDRHGEPSKHTVLKEPKSALEHYEKAVERETQGNLGDSLDLYRKAFRLDHQVDKAYKNKHFPVTAFPSSKSTQSSTLAPSSISASAVPSSQNVPQLPISDLIAGFSGMRIEPAPPAIEGTKALPCPISQLPEEILMHILVDLVIQDVASYVRLAQVCKRFAYLVSSEDQIWRRTCTGSEVGFGAMHYTWQRDVYGNRIEEDDISEIEDIDDVSNSKDLSLTKEQITESLMPSAYQSWQQMFRQRPRIRFNGCYISTVNYIRAGQASQSQVTWSSPVHIVTYFRYLRFFRDGTVISLLTTVEPADVVHHLTKELQVTHRGGAAAYLPSIFMQHALRGRWRMSSITDSPKASLKDAEGDLFVETEGPNEKYLYRMKLSLRSAGKGARNNKLVWQGFWNYNILTDDTGEFTLRNDKAFYFSRVKSYGMGA